MLLSEFNNDTATGISAQAASMLLDPMVVLSLTNEDENSTSTWYNATNVWNRYSNDFGRSRIGSKFNLSASDVNILSQWYSYVSIRCFPFF